MDDSQTIYKPTVLFFDMNETVLDTAPLKDFINNSFQENIYDLWFSKLLHYSLVSTVTHTFKDFGLIALESLVSLSARKGVDISKNISIKLISILSSLPPHPDVSEALKTVKEKGYYLVALSNSSKDLLRNQLRNAKIGYLFNQQISVEDFQVYKPHPDVYRKASCLLPISQKECMLIAAHDWDVYGALCAGWRSIFLQRDKQCLYPFSIKPELECIDLLSFAKRM